MRMVANGHALLEAHRQMGEPLTEIEVKLICLTGAADLPDFEQTGGNMYRYAKDEPLVGDPWGGVEVIEVVVMELIPLSKQTLLTAGLMAVTAQIDQMCHRALDCGDDYDSQLAMARRLGSDLRQIADNVQRTINMAERMP